MCARKLWLYCHGIRFEEFNEDVRIGKEIDSSSYKSKDKHILIDDTINIDFVSSKKEIHEVKKSSKLFEVSEWQLKYYLYYLKNKGVEGLSGCINIPEENKRYNVVLTSDDENKLADIIGNIKKVVDSSMPPAENHNKNCNKCAYYEYCFV